MLKSPQKLTITLRDHWRSLVNLLFIFRINIPYPPGLYYTGQVYDKEAPLVVSCNFVLTVLLLYYRLKKITVRVLVIDTKGVNVWCSAGKGNFSAEAIINELSHYSDDVIGSRSVVILPKLSLSGVRLKHLRENGLTPVIGPVYMKELPTFLACTELADRTEERLLYNIKDRLFIFIPSLIQFAKYLIFFAIFFLLMRLIFNMTIPMSFLIIGLSVIIGYQVLFPFLVGKGFVHKGISLAVTITAGIAVYSFLNGMEPLLFTFNVLFTFATSIFFALYYTGNSGVSNYSSVKKEIIRYLPLSVFLYVAAFVSYVIHEVRI